MHYNGKYASFSQNILVQSSTICMGNNAATYHHIFLLKNATNVLRCHFTIVIAFWSISCAALYVNVCNLPSSLFWFYWFKDILLKSFNHFLVYSNTFSRFHHPSFDSDKPKIERFRNYTKVSVITIVLPYLYQLSLIDIFLCLGSSIQNVLIMESGFYDMFSFPVHTLTLLLVIFFFKCAHTPYIWSFYIIEDRIHSISKKDY